jgi:hypothetical protein
MNRNDFDRTACQDAFQAYRDCKKAWVRAHRSCVWRGVAYEYGADGQAAGGPQEWAGMTPAPMSRTLVCPATADTLLTIAGGMPAPLLFPHSVFPCTYCISFTYITLFYPMYLFPTHAYVSLVNPIPGSIASCSVPSHSTRRRSPLSGLAMARGTSSPAPAPLPQAVFTRVPHDPARGKVGVQSRVLHAFGCAPPLGLCGREADGV